MTNKKIVYISHPMGGDILGNTQKVIAICRQIHNEEVVPFVPYLAAFQYLDDTDPRERQKGIDASTVFFTRPGAFDELWLYGNRISEGMRGEIILALENSIPVVAKTAETAEVLSEIIVEQAASS